VLGIAKKGNSTSRPDDAEPTYKILHIMSYHSPWRWTDGQFEGFKEALRELHVEYKVFQMDTKRNSSVQWKEKKGQEARQLIERWKPDLVYSSDDDAQQYVVKYYVNSDTPFVFSGVNQNPEAYGFPGSRNITGVMEQEHFVETVRLLKQVVPTAHKIAVVFDDASIWSPVMKRMKDKAIRLQGVELAAWDTIKTFAEYKHKIRDYQSTIDAIALIGIFNFKDEKGANVPYQDVLRWTAENSRLPDFSYWVDRVHYGTLCAVNVSEYEQGSAAGRIAYSILAEGRSPQSFSMKPTLKGNPFVSLARANRLGLKVNSGVLLTAEVIQHFEWER
jgi:ABC-type uncharacterized transport system substrate-binding protein